MPLTLDSVPSLTRVVARRKSRSTCCFASESVKQCPWAGLDIEYGLGRQRTVMHVIDGDMPDESILEDRDRNQVLLCTAVLWLNALKVSERKLRIC
jgi:hypothetical protein